MTPPLAAVAADILLSREARRLSHLPRAAVVAPLAALEHDDVLQFDSPGGTTLRVLDDGATGRADISSLSMTKTVTGLAEGDNALPFFTDATGAYSGYYTSTGSQAQGLAGRIAVNPALVGDPTKLVKLTSATESGDPQRPNFLYQKLTGTAFDFAAGTGLGTKKEPFSADLPTFLRQVLSMQGENAGNAQSLSQGQDVVDAIQQGDVMLSVKITAA